MLRDQIEEIVNGLSVNFYYGRKYEANTFSDNICFPAIILLESDQLGFDLNANGSQRDYDNVFIQFVDKLDGISQNAEARKETVNRMRRLAHQFLRSLNKSELFQNLSTRLPAFLLVDEYDANAQGIELNIPFLTQTYPEPC